MQSPLRGPTATCLVLVGLLVSEAPAQADILQLSLSQARDRALASAHAVRAAEYGLSAATGARRQSLATLLPTVQVREEFISSSSPGSSPSSHPSSSCRRSPSPWSGSCRVT